MNFEWNLTKASTNMLKHGVTFDEASTVFADERGLTIFDPDHSDSEDRFLTTGLSSQGKLSTVWHTERNGRTRLIGARKAD